MMRKPEGEESRKLILDALLDLPLGATMREVAAKIGKHLNTVELHVSKLRKTGQVQVIKRGFRRSKVVVPVRVPLTDTERDWLKLGAITARAIVVVAQAKGERVTSHDVAKKLGWRSCTAAYHLQRAKTAGILEARNAVGYILACQRNEDRELAGLDPRAWQAVHHIKQQARRVTSREIAQEFGWNLHTAQWHLQRAVKAGLLTVRIGAKGGYMISAGAERINWTKSNLPT